MAMHTTRTFHPPAGIDPLVIAVHGMSWTVLLAPAKVPPSRLELLNREVVKIVRSANLKDRLHELGSDAVGSTPDETSRFIGAEIAKWTKIIRSPGLQADLAR